MSFSASGVSFVVSGKIGLGFGISVDCPQKWHTRCLWARFVGVGVYYTKNPALFLHRQAERKIASAVTLDCMRHAPLAGGREGTFDTAVARRVWRVGIT